MLPPNCDRVGRLRVAPIGSPPSLYEDDASVYLSLVEPADFAPLFAPRKPSGHKGDYGHALIVAGSPGKTGAAAMSGLAALRAGAGLVTVASPAAAICRRLHAHAPELMTEALPASGSSCAAEFARNKDVSRIGPGLGTAPETVALVRRLAREMPQPMRHRCRRTQRARAGTDFAAKGRVRILTPHPGEMARLTGRPRPRSRRTASAPPARSPWNTASRWCSRASAR